LRVAGYIDMHNPDTAAMYIRGYARIKTPRALIIRTEFSHPLIKVKKGLWNPNVFFEDICGVLFFDYGLTDDKISYPSVGGEIKLETKIGFGYLQFVPEVGFAYTKEQKFKIFYKFGLVSPL
jgi:hypothetical protein